MTDRPKEKMFTSDRYYQLRHVFEGELHEDYDYSNAIAYGEIHSVKVNERKRIKIETTGYYDNGDSIPYCVTLQYLDEGKYGPIYTENHDEFRGYWFKKVPNNNLDCITFDNCVFDVEVTIKDLKKISFQNCFFLKNLTIEGKEYNIVNLDCCYFGNNLDIHDLETDCLFIRNCNVTQTVTISNCNVKKWTSIIHNFVKSGFHLLESNFLGNECLFDNIKTGYELEIYNCTFESTVEMTNCLVESLDVEESNFINLNVENIATSTYYTFEDLSPGTDKEIEEPDDEPFKIIGEDESTINDPFVHRIKRFESAIRKAHDRKSIIKFVHTNFNGLVSFSNVKTTALVFGCCRAYDEVAIMDIDQGRYFDHNSGPVQTMIINQKKQDHDIQFLDLGCTIFYENTEIQNVYRFIDLSETKFKDNSDIDEDYLNITKGWPIKRISNDTRLIDYSSRTLQELLVSCNRDEYDRREELFLDAKTQERRDCRPIFRIGYIAHELLSNYGKSPLRVLVFMAAIIGAFSLLFFVAGYGAIENCILDSCSSFFTIGLSITHLDDFTVKSLVVLEGALGFTLMSYFIVVLCDRRK